MGASTSICIKMMIYSNYRECRYMDKEKCNEGTSKKKNDTQSTLE